MQPVVEAAWIAVSGAIVSVIGTVSVAVSGFRNTRKITEATIQAAAQENTRAHSNARIDRLWERKAATYADFITHARAYRNALRAFEERSKLKSTTIDMSSLAVAANNAASLVFIVLESRETYDGCRAIIRAITESQAALTNANTAISRNQATKLNNDMAQLLRNFQVAARAELGVGGIDSSVIRTRHEPGVTGSIEP